MGQDGFVNQVQRVGTDTAGLLPGQGAVIFPASQFIVTNLPDVVTTGPDGETITGATEVALVSGPIGPAVPYPIAVTSTGPATATLATAALKVNRVAGLFFIVSAVNADGSALSLWESGKPQGYDTFGTPGPGGNSPSQASNYGLPVNITASWLAGVLTLTGTGPTVNVLGAADNGAGKVRLTVNGPINASLATQSVTGAGIGGTTEANGAHVVGTFVDSTHVDFPSVPFVHAWTSGGTLVFTTPPVLTWCGYLLVVAPP